MRKLLLLAAMGGVAYGLRKLYEDIERHPEAQRVGPREEKRVATELPEGSLDAEPSESDQERLDEALRDSFPASDPPSLGRPS